MLAVEEEPVAFDKPVAMEERVHTIEEAAVEPVASARAREDAIKILMLRLRAKGKIDLIDSSKQR